jgi:hypothetical protein
MAYAAHAVEHLVTTIDSKSVLSVALIHLQRGRGTTADFDAAEGAECWQICVGSYRVREVGIWWWREAAGTGHAADG